MLGEQSEVLRNGDEKALRELKMGWPDTIEQLSEVVQAVTERQHDYGTCVYAMSIAAEAAFNFVANKLGVTGFQAGCADLDVVRRTRSLKGPFGIIKAEDLLYPQYDIRNKVEEMIKGWMPWASEEAGKLLAEKHDHVHPDVKAHWEKLVAQREPAAADSN